MPTWQMHWISAGLFLLDWDSHKNNEIEKFQAIPGISQFAWKFIEITWNFLVTPLIFSIDFLHSLVPKSLSDLCYNFETLNWGIMLFLPKYMFFGSNLCWHTGLMLCIGHHSCCWKFDFTDFKVATICCICSLRLLRIQIVHRLSSWFL